MNQNDIKNVICGLNYTILLISGDFGILIFTFYFFINEIQETSLMVFGQNDKGQLGINSLENQFLPHPIRAYKNIRSVHCGGNHSFLLMSKFEF